MKEVFKSDLWKFEPSFMKLFWFADRIAEALQGWVWKGAHEPKYDKSVRLLYVFFEVSYLGRI